MTQPVARVSSPPALRRGARTLAFDLVAFVVAVGVAITAYGLATNEDVTVHMVLVNTLGFSAIQLPCLAIYLTLLWVAVRWLPSTRATRFVAVLLAPLAFVVLLLGGKADGTDAATIALTFGLPAFAYGAVVRLPSAPGGARRPRSDAPHGRRPAG